MSLQSDWTASQAFSLSRLLSEPSTRLDRHVGPTTYPDRSPGMFAYSTKQDRLNPTPNQTTHVHINIIR